MNKESATRYIDRLLEQRADALRCCHKEAAESLYEEISRVEERINSMPILIDMRPDPNLARALDPKRNGSMLHWDLILMALLGLCVGAVLGRLA